MVDEVGSGPGLRLPRPAAALRQAFADGYSLAHLRADVLAGLVVGIVALPLSMALAIATGMPPQYGLYTAIVAGAVIALLGGSRCQVSGPTAAFVAILLPVTAKFGPGGLMIATALAGLMLMALGLARLGRLIEFVPYPVITGFTAGIAVVIATGQVKDLLGLEGVERGEHWHEVVGQIVAHAHTLDPWDFGIGLLTLLLLIWLPKVIRRVPAPLLAIGATAVLAHFLNQLGGVHIATIASKFSYLQDGVRTPGIPPWPPQFHLPWDWAGPDGLPLELSWVNFKTLLGMAVAICMLGAIESLLSAVAADAMSGTRHDPDAELLAQGAGNLIAPFFGGFAATGAIARTATNIRSGARSPIAALVHVLFLLAAMLLLAPILGEMPMAAMAALLMMVAWRMADGRHFVHVMRTAPRSDILVLLCCFVFTVGIDMVWGVTAGMVLASLLFMRRMAELSGTRLMREQHPEHGPIPAGVLVYEIEGPLFFGAATRTMNALQSIGGTGAVVLDLDGVPVMDATGVVNLESAISRLHKAHVPLVITGLQPRVSAILDKAHVAPDGKHLHFRGTLQEGVALAGQLAAQHAARPQPGHP
jgi:sulfate permease, SulP family